MTLLILDRRKSCCVLHKCGTWKTRRTWRLVALLPFRKTLSAVKVDLFIATLKSSSSVISSMSIYSSTEAIPDLTLDDIYICLQ